MEFEICQHIDLTNYGINDNQLMDYLKDYRFAPYDVRSKVLNCLVRSKSASFIEKLNNDVSLAKANLLLKNNDKKTYDDFLKFIYDFILTAQTEIMNSVHELYPALDMDCYSPPYEEMQNDKQLDIDVLDSILSNWSLSYRINKLCYK